MAGAGAGDVELDYAAIHELLNDPLGPVGELFDQLSDQVATVARAKVRMRHGNTWSPRSNAAPEGFTQASIRTTVHVDPSTGRLWGGAGAAEDAGIFLEHPARQIEEEGHKFPFLTVGLDSTYV